MNTPTRAPSPRARSWRSGSTLVVTMIVLAFVASVLSISSGQMLGMHNLQGANLIAQSNSNAAEAGASLVEEVPLKVVGLRTTGWMHHWIMVLPIHRGGQAVCPTAPSHAW